MSNFFPILKKGIESLILFENELNDNGADTILEWILNGPSIDTINVLGLSWNGLTRIPRQIKYFQQLSIIVIDNQNKGKGLGTIPESFFPPSAKYIDLSSSQVFSIQPGAFPGLTCINLFFDLIHNYKYHQ